MALLHPASKCFESDQELESFLYNYGKQENKAFRYANTHKIKSSENSSLVGIFKSRGEGKRRITVLSQKCDCPFVIHVRNKKGIYVVMSESSHFEHNEACAKKNPGFTEFKKKSEKPKQKSRVEESEVMNESSHNENNEACAKDNQGFMETKEKTEKPQQKTREEETIDLLLPLYGHEVVVKFLEIIQQQASTESDDKESSVKTTRSIDETNETHSNIKQSHDFNKFPVMLDSQISIQPQLSVIEEKNNVQKTEQEVLENSCQLKFLDISSSSDDAWLKNITFAQETSRRKGRPMGTEKLNVMGCPIQDEPKIRVTVGQKIAIDSPIILEANEVSRVEYNEETYQ